MPRTLFVVEPGTVVDSDDGRSMGDHGHDEALVIVLVGFFDGRDERGGVGIEGRSQFFPDPRRLGPVRCGVSRRPLLPNFLQTDFRHPRSPPPPVSVPLWCSALCRYTWLETAVMSVCDSA